jgi:phosphatidylglycerophosphatase A
VDSLGPPGPAPDQPGATLARLFASGAGTGFSPWAPGTVASVAAVLIGAAMLTVSPWLVLPAALLATAAGFVVLPRAKVEGDPSWVVIDEFAGQWFALAALPGPSVTGLLAAFVLFRLLDIAKPGPVGWADRQHGVFGIMMDDVIAGLTAAVVLLACRWAWPEGF